MVLKHMNIWNILILGFIPNIIIIPVYSSHILSGNITSNITWLLSELNTRPALRWDYHFIVEFPSDKCCPLLSAYHTHRDYLKLECFAEGAKGELVWLKNWIHFLNPKENVGNVPYDGSVATCTEKGTTTKCTGTFRQQDFEPKFRYYIFGFFCEDLRSISLSLNGLNYTITVLDETNVTTCEKVHDSTSGAQRCSKYSNFATFPNVFGDYSQIRASSTFDSLAGILKKMDIPCYKHLEEALCIVIFPPCLNITVSSKGEYKANTISAMCRETCQDFGSSCGVHLGEAFSNILYCEYFHYKEDSNTCYYRQVFCDTPYSTTNSDHNIIEGNTSFFAGTIIQYSCHEGYQPQDSGNSTCLLSGEWSSKSQCTLADLDSHLSVRNALLFNGTPLLTMLVRLLLLLLFYCF